MTISEKYLEALKTLGDWVIVSEWAKKFAELYPDEYAKAETQAHNGKKNKSNWTRFSIDEQIEYIEAVIRLQMIVAPKFGIELESKVYDNLIVWLRDVF